MTALEIAALADETGIRLVRFLWCGNDGTVRAKASGRHGLEGRLESGIGLTVAMQAMSGLDRLQPVGGMGPVGEVRLVPDLGTFRVLPYAPRTGAVLTDHVGLDGEPAPVCQRSFLKRMEARLAERGLVLRASFENEFSLATRVDGGYVPIDSSLCYSTIGMTVAQDYVDELAAALEAQGIALEQYYAELGHGQQEISTGHAPALQAADEQLLVRETIRGVAARHGLVASLAPKPWPDNAGNGGHVHFSLWEGSRNRFYEGSAPDGLSADARSFVAGVLDHLPALCGLTAPSFNSYHRILPQYWAGAFTCWGYDNREAPVRVASVFRGAEEASTNAELKACDASCNPYLALGALIAAGLDGLERGLEPPDPVPVDPATIDEAERARRGILPLPATQADALDALEADELLAGALGPVLAGSYLAVRRSEWAAYSNGRRAIRAAGTLREVLSAILLVDQHAHGILRAQPAGLDAFRGLFSESPDPRQWPHVATGVAYRRAIGVLAEHLGCEPDERAVFERRLATDPDEYAASFLRATNTELLFLDDGFPPAGAGTTDFARIAGVATRPVLRLETRRIEPAEARGRGYVALKTIAAYRGGLDRVSEDVVAALAANEATGKPLPVQVHCGFGDPDLHLWRADPSYLKPLVERFRETAFVLLHCYPFVREAGWLAHAYANVYLDLSLTIPHVGRPAAALAEALELAPVSKLLYASDAARTPELYLLAATWWRDALAEVLPELLGDGAEDAARRILRENALAVYSIGGAARYSSSVT